MVIVLQDCINKYDCMGSGKLVVTLGQTHQYLWFILVMENYWFQKIF